MFGSITLAYSPGGQLRASGNQLLILLALHFLNRQKGASSFSQFKSIRQSAFSLFFSENAAGFYLMKSYPVPRPSKIVTPFFFPGCIQYNAAPGKRLKRQIPNLSLEIKRS